MNRGSDASPTPISTGNWRTVRVSRRPPVSISIRLPMPSALDRLPTMWTFTWPLALPPSLRRQRRPPPAKATTRSVSQSESKSANWRSVMADVAKVSSPSRAVSSRNPASPRLRQT